MKSSDIRSRFLAFFEKRGHAIIPSSPLVPLNDPSVLFNTAGMQPLVPYLLGEKHPSGTRIADVQKCVRTGDLEDIGDNRHFSFFEMMGNWSLGDYFKKEAIEWSFDFLTSKEEGLGLDVSRLYVTIFEGDENAPLDTEAKEIWMSLGIPEHRIYALPADDNWWSPGQNGPCGPCSEMFYDMIGTTGDLTHEQFIAACDSEEVVEVWNDVFMEYEKRDGKVIGKLSQKNVDTGAGLERITAVMQGKRTAYDTDIFAEAKKLIVDTTNNYDEKAVRIVLDHTRAAVFMIAAGVVPDNKAQGYVLRRLIRRAVLKAQKLGLPAEFLGETLGSVYISQYKDVYPELADDAAIRSTINAEEVKFLKTLEQGLREFEKGTDAFTLATTYGFPVEVTLELAAEKGTTIDLEDFNTKMEEHQKLSQSASAGMFKGGLADSSIETTKLHTAHHLLLAALQQVLGDHVHQKGSNITAERLRIDFSHGEKMTDEQKAAVEKIVNDWIAADLPMQRIEMPREEAESIGAEMEFGAKYPDMVSVYIVGSDVEHAVSKEFCGGPHMERTGGLGTFKIQKEEASSSGVRRIKGVLV